MAVKVSNNFKKDIISKYLYKEDVEKGMDYFSPYIGRLTSIPNGNITRYRVGVESERTSRIYDCSFSVDKNLNQLKEFSCNCPQFQATNSCKHLAAVFFYYFEEIFKVELSDDYKQDFTLKLLRKLNKNEPSNKRVVKEEVKIDIELSGNNYNANRLNILELTLKVGTSKLYSAKGKKLRNFLDAIKNQEGYEFGKNFIYDPSKHYFSKENEEIINYLTILNDYNTGNSYYDYQLLLKSSVIKKFLNLIKDRKYSINGYVIHEISNTFPFNSNLELVDDKYKLKLDFNDKIRYITSDLEYVQIENTLYHLDLKTREFLTEILANEVYELIFTSRKKESFKENILPIVKTNILIDSKIDDIKITLDMKPKLYFDLYRDLIICNLILKYDDVEINYFDTKTNVLREKDKEELVIEDLYKVNFQIEDNKIVLDDINNIGKFLDEDLLDLTEKYETYTSEKLKNIKVIKKSNVKSTFSIGQDNILSYNFDLGDIKDSEIVNILESLKDKKKYYRLKSGDIIDLEHDPDLKELEKLTEDMDLSKSDLKKGNGIIPKYRAIYLDSLKNSKYHIIETNNLFDDLIDKFNKYKDSEISLDDEGKKLLRNYQVEGVKWLYNIDKTGFGGILADEMGLGKSIQTIYYIKELLKEDSSYKFLIVAPTSLAYNWENEFIKFGNGIKYLISVGVRSKRREELNNLDNISVIITTYGLLREDKEIYENINFKTMIIDEAQNIKNVNTEVTKTVKSIKAKTCLALTGTPIENSLTELWSIFDYIMPGFLANLQTFDKKYKVKEFSDDDNEKLKNLNKLVSPFIMRRRKKDVIKDLPDKLENNIYVDLTREQKKLYLAELEKVNNEMNDIMMNSGINKARFLILQLLTKLRQICIDPRILFNDYQGGSGKIDEFLNIVKESVANQNKILVFTSFKTALNLAKAELDKEGITSYIIDGSVSSKKRMELVDKFNSDETNVFFIMLKAGGTGLNLTSASVVIHLDLWWNPQVENQATDRAHRIGQKNVVQVIRFITKGTIEEKILDLQSKKRILSDKILDSESDQNMFSKLTEEDIKNLLSYDNQED